MAKLEIRSELSGTIWKIEAAAGDMMATDATILIMESMKMEVPVSAPCAGRLTELHVQEADIVAEGQLLATMDR